MLLFKIHIYIYIYIYTYIVCYGFFYHLFAGPRETALRYIHIYIYIYIYYNYYMNIIIDISDITIPMGLARSLRLS